MLESKIKLKIKKKLEAEGWVVIYLIRTNMNGIPDVLAIRNGKSMFIEVKTTKGVLAPLQKFRIDQLRKLGFEVYVWTGYQINYEI